MVAIPLELTHTVLDVLAVAVGIIAVITGWFVVMEIEGKGDLKNSMIFATFAVFFFTLTQVTDYLGEKFYEGSEGIHVLNRILFLTAMVLIFFAGRLILRFFKGISFNKR